jgi:hypothetical protein
VVVVADVGGGGSRSLEEGAGAGEVGATGPGIGSPVAIVATVLGAIAGATAVILGANLTSRRQLQGVRMTLEENRTLEDARLRTSREDLIITAPTDAVQPLAMKMSTALHSMCWLTWLARTAPERVTKERLDLYDAEQHKTLPEIGGYSTTVAALDKGVHEKIEPLIKEIYDLDWVIGEAGLLLDNDRDEMIRKLVKADRVMVKVELELPGKLGDIISDRVREPPVTPEVRELIASIGLDSADRS